MAKEQGTSGKMRSHVMPNVRYDAEGKDYYVFYTSNHIFSNFYHLDGLKYEGHSFHCSEQLYFYMKAMHFGDKETAEAILAARTPMQAKRYSTLVENLDQSEWIRVSVDYMFKANMEKYTQFPELAQALLQTEEGTIVEASPTDKFWGIGMRIDNPSATAPKKWKGKNMLGVVLMRVRKELKDGHSL